MREPSEIKLQAALVAMHDAFMAMCAYRDSHDDEVFQDAIDALGLAANRIGDSEDSSEMEKGWPRADRGIYGEL